MCCGLCGAHALFYSAIGHGLVGAVTGAVFPIQALLGLMVLTTLESAATTVLFGLTAGLWSLVNLVALQVGYLAGIYIRSLLEKAGLAQPSTRVHHT